jgi:hypothetical protein
MFHPFFPVAANFWPISLFGVNRHASRRVKINRKSATITCNSTHVLLGVPGVRGRVEYPDDFHEPAVWPDTLNSAIGFI